VIVHDTRLVPKDLAPRKRQDVLDLRWRGKVAHGHPGDSGVVTTGMVGILRRYGWDCSAVLAKSQPVLGQSAEDPPVKLAGGEGSIAVSARTTSSSRGGRVSRWRSSSRTTSCPP
jgi:iron(III) transport system substrate-binding protein